MASQIRTMRHGKPCGKVVCQRHCKLVDPVWTDTKERDMADTITDRLEDVMLVMGIFAIKATLALFSTGMLTAP